MRELPVLLCTAVFLQLFLNVCLLIVQSDDQISVIFGESGVAEEDAADFFHVFDILIDLIDFLILELEPLSVWLPLWGTGAFWGFLGTTGFGLIFPVAFHFHTNQISMGHYLLNVLTRVLFQ